MAASSNSINCINAETRTQTSRYRIKWIIHNILHPISNPLVSPSFCLGDGVECKFLLKHVVLMNQQGQGHEFKTFVSANYRDHRKVCYIDRLEFQNSNQAMIHDWSAHPPFRMEGGLAEPVRFGEDIDLKTMSESRIVSPDNSLTFYCYLTVVEEIIAPINVKVLLHNLAKDFEKELYSSKSSDVTLEVENDIIPAHKAVLSARSPVFAAMFDSGMSEQLSGHVRISDIKKEAMRELIRFIYCCKVDRLQDMAYDLLPAADKYCLPDLKDMCERTLVNQIKVENVFIYLELAKSHQCDELRKACIHFIKANPKEVMSSGTDVFGTHAYLLAEVFEELVGK